jgi:hypothetical protein
MGLRGPGLHKPSRGHLPTRKAVVEWLARATSRCRPFTDSGPGGRLPRVRLLPRSLLLQRSNPTESTTNGGEGLPQTTPLLSAWGRKWGPTPQGSMNKSSQRSLMHCSRKPYETHPRGEVRVAEAMPEGHCGGFGTSARMRCGMLKRLGTRRRRPDMGTVSRGPTRRVRQQSSRHRQADSDAAGAQPEPQARGAQPPGDRLNRVPGAGPPATTEAPLARRTAAPPFTDSH